MQIDIKDAGMEDEEINFLYRNFPLIAKGHLCSAVWREIDPAGWLNENSMCEYPFGWPDGRIVARKYGEEIYRKFFLPDLRTEFVPVYTIANPDFEWKNDERPELDTAVLAELWDEEEIERKLLPLYRGYSRWIEEQEKQTGNLKEKEREIAFRLINRCRTVLERIKKGIDLLVQDEETRLCFCFANRAISLQSEWVTGKSLKWRPFQLAFILMVLESIVNPSSEFRKYCDLLWIPTGGGKTETYLAIIAFTLAMRRRRALQKNEGDRTGAGVAVITRYTLRLLTIQQFRRALRLITACEYLRVYGLGENSEIGWRPSKCSIRGHFIWGTTVFSAGLWVGGNVTPNRLTDTLSLSETRENRKIPGALSILKGEKGSGEPVQVLECPACGSILAVPENGGISHSFTLHIVVETSKNLNLLSTGALSTVKLKVLQIRSTPHGSSKHCTLSFTIEPGAEISARELDTWWRDIVSVKLGVKEVCARASKPGYFIRKYISKSHGSVQEYDFDIFCTNPDCPLHKPWCAGEPAGRICDTIPALMCPTVINAGETYVKAPDNNRFIYVPEPFRKGQPYIADRIPVPALTVDSQIYSRCPSLLVATVDKFARLPFEPRAGSIFGNVDYHHCVYGYYRDSLPPVDANSSNGIHPSPAGTANNPNYVSVNRFSPPELIIQDELHLIEGPLGSLVGLYETAVDELCSCEGYRVKYIASTATVTRATEQVQSVFTRKLLQFPPPALDPADRFFLRIVPADPLNDRMPGRLYAGICAPGRGPLTPVIRIWARLMQTVYELAYKFSGEEIDPYWTLTGYFNAIRELAGARATYWQDIPERLKDIAEGGNVRQLIDSSDHVVELSGRTDSTELPALLELINSSFSGNPLIPGSPDAMFTTSMFGTGIDIGRLGLMVVHGQPKTTSAYIQSTGRVGRRTGALVVVFYRASRPRDMSHYEMFCGYHRALDRYVEPVTVSPFSPGALERAGGAVVTSILRNGNHAGLLWHRDDSASLMLRRRNCPEVRKLCDLMELRAQKQPADRRPVRDYCKQFIASELDRWKIISNTSGDTLKYAEYFRTTSDVVLGDPPHERAGFRVVFRNVPQSLRDIEETITFET
ncbi:DISARM system helicase DrmA [Caldicellulosiruptor acetigenus]|uniref:DISARM system helicase DrmA n=1 Tax=Caldicellulosiruptor acetigenus TaxID=301953 RepID=UPI0022A9227D|nr:DISARM system helicase DrmA [Caldicellulosiruptor acetigenus]WAM36581.1 DISARM system helicase DrmA [Caldicellulosiruptor acetigenus]